MAKREGLNSVTVWMIVFVGLWLASTVFLVILYTGQENLVTENANIKKTLLRTVTTQQAQSIDLIKPAQENGPTMVGLLEDARGTTAQLATGEATDAPPAVRAKRDQILVTIKTDGLVANPETFADLSYHQALTQLYESFKAAQTVRKAAEARAAQLETQMTAMVEAETALKADFEKKTQEASERLATAEAERTTYRADRDKMFETLQKAQDDVQKRHDDEIKTVRQEKLAAEQEAGAVQKRLGSFQTKVGGLLPGPEKLSTARNPDGKILTAVPGDKVVYVNLGKKNALTLGLKFAVYSGQTGIPADGKAKAQIEVASISDSSAECTVTQIVPNTVIMEGDLIANPIYDPNNPMTFVVAGDFDLDRDGASDRGGNLVIEDLVKKWGGKVGNDLTPLTDFVVLGVKPRDPRTAGGPAREPGQAPPPNPAAERYDRVASQSAKFAIPVLTQEVFLNYLGYSDRQARR
jgi:hypothetical protein